MYTGILLELEEIMTIKVARAKINLRIKGKFFLKNKHVKRELYEKPCRVSLSNYAAVCSHFKPLGFIVFKAQGVTLPTCLCYQHDKSLRQI